jgi:hypothetical protein
LITSTVTLLKNLVLATSFNHCSFRSVVGTEIRILAFGLTFNNFTQAINAPYDLPTPVLQTQMPLPLLLIHFWTPNL